MLSITDIKLKDEVIAESVDKTTIQVSIIFDKECLAWHRNAIYNYSFLKSIEEHMNFILKCRGWLILNDVYDALGMSLTKDGMTAGWVYGLGETVNFGLTEPENYQFIEGIKNTMTLVCEVHPDIREFI